MIKLLEDNTVICGDGANVNSHHPEKTSCTKGYAIATAFTYRHDINYTRTDEHIEDLSFDGLTVTADCHDCTVTGQEGNIKLIDRANHETRSIDPLQDISTESDRVKTFCGLVFDAAVESAFIVSLPTVDQSVTEMRQQTVDLPVMIDNLEYDAEVEGSPKLIQEIEMVTVDVEETVVLVGAVLTVVAAHQTQEPRGLLVATGVTDEAGVPVMEDYDTGEVVTLIEYKGNLYESPTALMEGTAW